jgi:hypothetical protein
MGLWQSCKNKTQEIPPTINVSLTVYDETHKVVHGARAYLYNNQSSFQQAVINSQSFTYNANGSFLMDTTNSLGVVNFNNIPSNTEYWVLVHDNSQFFVDNNGGNAITTTYRIERDNTDAYYYITGFQNGSIITANVLLAPINSLVQFTDNTGSTFQKVVLRNHDSTQVFNSAKYLNIRKGDFPYFIRDNQCVWTGAVVAIGGQVVHQTLGACSGNFIIFNHTFAASESPINIYLGQNKALNVSTGNTVPDLTLTALTPSDTIVLASGSYTYFAQYAGANPSKCVWEDSVLAVNTLGTCK